MSESLSPVDLSTIAVGGTGKIDLSVLKTAYNNPTEQASAHIRIFNESGSTLLIRSDTGILQDYIPAGAWPTYSIDHSVQTINFTVKAIVPNAPIQLLLATYFGPGEEVPPVPQLGNSPVNVGNTILQAQQIQQLGFPTGTFVVQAGADANPVNAALVLYNDGHGSMGALPGAEVSWDTQGNMAVQTLTAFQIKVDNVPILVATNQETGSCGLVENNCVNTSTIGGRQNFKTQMTNVPTSISFVDITTLNAGPISTPNIDKTGFTIVWTPAAAGQSFRIETYTTVGN